SDDLLNRKLSVYDNVDIKESIDAARKQSSPHRDPSDENESYFVRDSKLNESIKSVEHRSLEQPTSTSSKVEKDEQQSEQLSISKRSSSSEHPIIENDKNGSKQQNQQN